MHDYHVHSNYSDGRFLPSMVATAARLGLEGVGFADHCNVSPRTDRTAYKQRFGFNLDMTYERRRAAIEGLRGEFDVDIYDAVEMDYDSRDEAVIADFLDDAGFDYAVGSVHAIEGHNVHDERYFGGKSQAGREAVVEAYVEELVALVDSELFDIAAHVDILQRNSALRGLLDEDHYHAIAAALADSRTVPELNAGRVNEDYGGFHPTPTFRDVLADYGVDFTLGSDAHSPSDLEANVASLRGAVEEGLDPVAIQ